MKIFHYSEMKFFIFQFLFNLNKKKIKDFHSHFIFQFKIKTMILEFLEQINKKKIILGSKSPQRRMIFDMTGIKYEVQASKFEENLDHSAFPTPIDYVKANAIGKTTEVATRFPDADLIIGCDTVLYYDGKILEKPEDADEARRTLRMLSGDVHQVISVVCLCYPTSLVDGKPIVQIFEDISEVHFIEMTDAFIEKYIESGKWVEQAGSYHMQDTFSPIFIKKINGCYWNAIGFPCAKFCEKLMEVAKDHWF